MTRLLVLAALAILTGIITAAGLRIVLRPCDCDSDIEALITATRETAPDYVPAEWTREYNQ